MNIPNILTLMRISFIPIFVLVFYLPIKGHFGISAVIFSIAAFTDWLDGYLARRLKQFSPLGEFLDPVADKLLVAVALIVLVQTYGSPWLALPAAVIVSREIVISALREWMAELGKRANVSVSTIGKWKTAAQMIAIIILIAGLQRVSPMPKLLLLLGGGLLYIAALLTLWSMVIYLRAARHDLLR